MKKSILSAACVALLLPFGGAMAQEAGGGPGTPDVKQVGDWFVRCFPIESPSPCDMFQELDSPTTKQRVLSISLAYVPSVDRHALQLIVPLEIAIQKGVTIKTDTFTSPVFKYRSCDRNGCKVGPMLIDNSVAESIARSGGEKGKVTIVADNNGKTFALDFYLKGFADAHTSMVSQARAKAKAAKPADAAPAAP
jgi:invasion protein IalB